MLAEAPPAILSSPGRLVWLRLRRSIVCQQWVVITVFTGLLLTTDWCGQTRETGAGQHTHWTTQTEQEGQLVQHLSPLSYHHGDSKLSANFYQYLSKSRV